MALEQIHRPSLRSHTDEEPPALAPHDLLSPEAFEHVRALLLPAVRELRRRRRCRIGPTATLAFETRETVLWHIQEILRVEGRSAPHQVVEELARYDCLVPRVGELRATLMIDGGSHAQGQRIADRIATGRPVLRLRVGTTTCAADCVEREMVDCPVYYLRFAASKAGIRALDLLQGPVAIELLSRAQGPVIAPAELCEALATDLQIGALEAYEEAAE